MEWKAEKQRMIIFRKNLYKWNHHIQLVNYTFQGPSQNRTRLNIGSASIHTFEVVGEVEELRVLLEDAAVVVEGQVGSDDGEEELFSHNADVEVRLFSGVDNLSGSWYGMNKSRFK